MKLQIISGGQTGVDTAALLAAEAHSLPICGYVPKDYTNELGAYRIPARFWPFLTLTNTTESSLRTELNCTEADGILTLLKGENRYTNVSKGTQHGIDHARSLGKSAAQLCFVDLASTNLVAETEKVVSWIVDTKVTKCAIGGPRESEVPGIEVEADAFLREVFKRLSS